MALVKVEVENEFGLKTVKKFCSVVGALAFFKECNDATCIYYFDGSGEPIPVCAETGKLVEFWDENGKPHYKFPFGSL